MSQMKRAIETNVIGLQSDAKYVGDVATTARDGNGTIENVLVLTSSLRILVDAHRELAKRIATSQRVNANPYLELRQILSYMEHSHT